MPNYLTTQSQIACPHGGQLTLTTANSAFTADGAPVLLDSDIHIVKGCAFTIGVKPSPCLQVQWAAGSSMTSGQSGSPLTQASVGKCLSPEGAPQGVALVSQTQQKVEAL